jgi:hypothetical protein
MKAFTVEGTSRKLTLDVDAGRLLAALAADYHRTVRPIDVGAVDDAGYCDRDARAAKGQKSNHANATALDINWSEEGAQNSSWGKKFFAQIQTQAAIRAIKQRYGSCVQWGGDWSPKFSDFMHWEIKPGVSRADVVALADRLGIDKNGIRKAS